jgi:mono/diheme cytochrome c family protein
VRATASTFGRGVAAGIAIALSAALLAGATPALAQDAAQVAAGRMVWRDAGCDGCHGANGQGGTSPDLPAGPSLRATKLDRKGLTEVISCGKPGTQMAAWLDGAYTRTPCFGTATGQPPADAVVVGAYSAAEIAALTDFLIATFVGK